MSAFVVDTVHIDLLVEVARKGPSQWHSGPGNPWRFPQYVERYGVCPEGWMDDPDLVGRLLLTENIRSVAHRYPNEPAGELPGPIPTPAPDLYVFNAPGYRLTAVEALHALACWRYQTCETPDHAETPAWRFVDALESSLIRTLPGYEDAPWEWTSETVAKRMAARHD